MTTEGSKYPTNKAKGDIEALRSSVFESRSKGKGRDRIANGVGNSIEILGNIEREICA
jgi:hypothetical protein